MRRLRSKIVNAWRSWGRRRRVLVISAGLIGILVIVLGALVGTGVSAALDARRAANDLEGELRSLTPLDLIQATAYRSLEDRFREVEASAAKARSRLAFLRAFRWVPFLGGRIKENELLMDMGFLLARAGGNLSEVYRSTLEGPLDQTEPGEASVQVSDSMRRGALQLSQVQADLARVGELRRELDESAGAGRYAALVDRYLPAIQAATHISQSGPDAVGGAYVVGRELEGLRRWVDDPLEVVADPQRAGSTLSTVVEGAAKLESSLSVIRQGAERGGLELETNREAVLDVLRLMEQGAIILHHTTAGARGLVAVAESIEVDGFLSSKFGAAVGPALQGALVELELAGQEVDSFQQLLSLRGLEEGQLLPVSLLDTIFQAPTGESSSLKALLEEISDVTRFFSTFLGYDGPRTYLLLGQNQNEIRATGGLIGVVVEATLDKGELATFIYKDSTTIDPLPLIDNPFPPDPLYWYLWMGRLLFRDANWDPHFPASAATIAEFYREGQGVNVDGVIAGTKSLILDLVDVFGDITVPQIDEVLTRDVAELYAEGILPYGCGPQHSSGRGKRCFDQDLVSAIRERTIGGLPGGLKRQLVEQMRTHLRSKALMIHVLDPQEGGFLWERGWNGAVPAVDHDFLMAVDSSLAGHSVARVQRSLEYRVSLNPGHQSEAVLRLHYKHLEELEDPVCRQAVTSAQGCFFNYFRLYLSPLARDVQMPPVPLHQGSEKLIWGYPDPDSASLITQVKMGSGRFTEVGGYIAIEPGSIITVPIRYQLNSEALRQTADGAYEYRLLIQKQPGIDRDHITVVVDLPPEAELTSTSLSLTARRGQMLLFDFTLQEDTLIAVSFRTA